MRGILLVSFGTTHERARREDIEPVARRLEEEFPDALLEQAYTSGMVRRSLGKRGIEVPSVGEALSDLVDKGVSDLLVQPTHILPGDEHGRMTLEVEASRGLFERVVMGDPLLASDADFVSLVDALGAEYAREPETAVVFMGHGTTNFSNAAYAALDYRFKAVGRDDIFVGTVEAYPALEDVMHAMEPGKFSRVALAPLMLVAGDHATNDMAGADEDSWAQVLSAAGYDVTCHVRGLGALPGVRDIYASHALAAWGPGGGHGSDTVFREDEGR